MLAVLVGWWSIQDASNSGVARTFHCLASELL